LASSALAGMLPRLPTWPKDRYNHGGGQQPQRVCDRRLESVAQSGRTLIHVDIDAGSIGRVYPTDLGIAAPAEVALEAIFDRLPQAEISQRFGIQYDRDAELDLLAPRERSARRARCGAATGLPCDTIYTTDSGLNHFFAAHYLKIDHADSFVSLWGMGSMGKRSAPPWARN